MKRIAEMNEKQRMIAAVLATILVVALIVSMIALPSCIASQKVSGIDNDASSAASSTEKNAADGSSLTTSRDAGDIDRKKADPKDTNKKNTATVKDKDGKEITINLDDPNVKVNADGTITTPQGTYKPTSPPTSPPSGSGGNDVVKVPIYCHDGAHPITRQEPVYETRPVYETQPVYEWQSYAVCNTCGQKWVGGSGSAPGEHLALNPTHAGYSTGQEQVQVGTQQVQVGTQQVQVGTKTVVVCATRTIVGYR